MLRSKADIEQQVYQWIKNVVIGLELCPFAKWPYVEHLIKVAICEASSEEKVLEFLSEELTRLHNSSSEQIETTLLVLTQCLSDFTHFNQFLDDAEQLLQRKNMIGEFQIASFHPAYRFAGTKQDDKENYTNRAPYPILHILREASIEHAVESYPQVEQIPTRNIQTMNNLTTEQIQRLFPYLF